MITINGKKFAETDAEFVDSLFDADGTCVGYAKRLKHSVKLFDHQHKLIGTITKYGVLAKATPLDNGKVWYSYGDIDEIGRVSVSQFRKDLDNIKTEKLYNAPEYFYKFK